MVICLSDFDYFNSSNSFSSVLFFLIFNASDAYNCSWFNLINDKNYNNWRQKLGGEWPLLTTFFLMAIVAITGTCCDSVVYRDIDLRRFLLQIWIPGGQNLSSMGWMVKSVSVYMVARPLISSPPSPLVLFLSRGVELHLISFHVYPLNVNILV